MGMDVQRHVPAALPPAKRVGTHHIDGWVDPRAGLDGCGKSRPHRDSKYKLDLNIPPKKSCLSLPGIIEWYPIYIYV